jgi:hypothetical protein
MGDFWRNARTNALELKIEKERAKAGKTFRRTGKHARKAHNANKQLERMHAASERSAAKKQAQQQPRPLISVSDPELMAELARSGVPDAELLAEIARRPWLGVQR